MDAIIGTGMISKREYGIIAERSISVPMSDGISIDVDIFRPDGERYSNAHDGTGKKRDADYGPLRSRRVTDQNGKLPPGDRAVLQRPGVSEIAPDIDQVEAGDRALLPALADLNDGVDDLAQSRFLLGRRESSQLQKMALQFAAVVNQVEDAIFALGPLHRP